MSYEAGGLGGLVQEIRQASENLTQGDAATVKRFEKVEASINELYLKAHRPGAAWESKEDDIAERKSAVELCHNRRALTIPKIDADVSDNYTPTSAEVDQALIHRKAIKALFRHGDATRLEPTFQKSLSAFSFGASGFLLAPEQSNQVLRCIVDPTDVAGLVNRVNISAPSIRFPIDIARMLTGGWACEASCFANNPQPDLSEGLGQLEIKAESSRFVVCATSDLLQDASFNVESWLLEKVSRGFRDTINGAILLGDGVGKPLGFLSPHAGIPVCDVSASTPPGAFTWQDL